MTVNNIDAVMLRNAFLAAAARLESQKERINELNVFPVPDGDTGTNMTLTIMSAAKAVLELGEDGGATVEALCKAMSGGSLRGARGNSGVILSQLLRGFTREIKGDPDHIDVHALARAMNRAADTAYKAVMKPKEGTILTVARGGADKALEIENTTDDVVEFLSQIVDHMSKVLDSTPDLLPVLKEAGVVDSGGTGLLECMKGALDLISGKDVPLATGEEKSESEKEAASRYQYNASFVINSGKQFTSADEIDLKHELDNMGRNLGYDSISDVKVNDKEVTEEKNDSSASAAAAAEPEAPSEHKENGFISVSAGAGLTGVFKNLGVDYVIEGGQTMNPSTEDMLNAISKVNADNIFIFPNNKNIILAANQARDLTEDKKIFVIPSKTVPQGITALLGFVEGDDPEKNAENMTEEMKNVKTGEITYAVRDTSIDGKAIKNGDIMGIGDEGIISVTRSVTETAKDMISHMVDGDSSLITLYYGADVKEEDAEALKSEIEAANSGIEVEMTNGGQPVYYYIISVE